MAYSCAHLFGHDFFIRPNGNVLDKLFCFAMQTICKVEKLTESRIGNISGDGREIETCREHLREFFTFLREYIRSISSNISQSHVDELILKLKSILLHIGFLSDLPRHMIPCGNCEKNACFATYHSYLDVYTSLIEIFDELEETSAETFYIFLQSHEHEVMYGSISSQICHLLLWCSVKLAVQKFENISYCDYQRSNFFPCEHAKETWCHLQSLLDSKHAQDEECDSFWVCMLHIYQVLLQQGRETHATSDELDCDKFLLPPEMECKNPIGFFWWMVSHLVSMHGDSEGGLKKNDGGCHFLVSELLKKTLSQAELPEIALRSYMKCLLVITQAIGPNLNIATDLWDLYFSKHLNDHFYLATLGMKGMPTTNESHSPSVWLGTVKQRMSHPLILKDSESSYDLFLRILVTAVMNNSDLSGWKKLKIRIYSKFHSRRMNELSELGLLNFSRLFLTLSTMRDYEDVSQKFSDFCQMLSLEKMDAKEVAVVIRALLSMVMFGQETKCQFDPIMDNITRLFQHIKTCFIKTVHAPTYHQQHWSQIVTYFDGVQEVLSTDHEQGDATKCLIGPGLADILKFCTKSELCYLLSNLQALFVREPLDAGIRNLAITNLLWQEVYPFIKEHAMTGTPPDQLADIAASFGLSLSLSADSAKEPLSVQFLHFATNNNVNPGTSCRYICHLMANVETMTQLKRTLPELDVHLIQAWLRCCLLLGSSSGSDQLKELTRLILQHQCLQHMLPATHDLNLNPIDIVIKFFKDIGNGFKGLEGFLDKSKYREQKTPYFSGVMKVVQGSLKAQTSGDIVKKIFSVCGHIVKSCPGLIYVKSKQDCMLPTLFERLILTHAIFDPKKPISPNTLPAIRDYLPLFVQGLSKLDYRRDAYLQRQMKNIVCQYLPRFSLKSQSSSVATSVHPIVSSLKASLTRTPTDEAGQLQMDVVEIVVTNFMPLRGTTAPNTASLGMSFCLEVLSRNLSSKQTLKTGTVLLMSILEYSLLSDDDGLRQQARKCLSTIMEAASKGMDEVIRESYSKTTLDFYKKHVKVHQIRVFHVMEQLASSGPAILVPIIKDLTAEVKASELKRGVGADSQLRQCYIRLLRNLGEAGLAEVKLL